MKRAGHLSCTLKTKLQHRKHQVPAVFWRQTLRRYPIEISILSRKVVFFPLGKDYDVLLQNATECSGSLQRGRLRCEWAAQVLEVLWCCVAFWWKVVHKMPCGIIGVSVQNQSKGTRMLELAQLKISRFHPYRARISVHRLLRRFGWVWCYTRPIQGMKRFGTFFCKTLEVFLICQKCFSVVGPNRPVCACF